MAALLFVFAFALSSWPAAPALAACDQTGSTVNCTGITNNYDAGTQTNLTITVQPGATVKGYDPNNAIRITNTFGNTIINNGTIDGFVTIVSLGGGFDDFTNNGVLKITDPNSPLQSHSIAGTNFVQSASGSLLLRVDNNGFNDSLLAYNVVLGGRFIAVIQPGLYTAPMNYSGVITTTTGITGAFASVAASSPFFSASLTPSGNNLDLTITRIAFNAVPGLTPNQRAVGNVLETAYATTPTGNAATLFSNLFAATSAGVLDQLSGAGTVAAQDGAFTAGSQFGNAMFQQVMDWLNGTPGGTGATVGATLGYAEAPKNKLAGKSGYDAFAAMPRHEQATPGRWRAWTLGFGGSRAVNGQASAGTADQTSAVFGGAFGVDRQLTSDFLLGFAAGGSGSNFSTSSLSTSGRINAGHVGAYAIQRIGAAYVAATLNYARGDTSTERTITGVGPTETAKGRFASDQLSGRIEIGRKYGVRGYSVTPFAAIEPAALWQHAYSETSTTAGGGPGVLGLSYQSNTVTSLPVFLGAQLDTRYALAGGRTLSPFARLAWVHEFKPERSIQASFISIPGAAFTADGARAAADALRVETGGTLTLGRSAALFVNLNSELSRRSRSIAALGGAKVTW